MENPELLLLEIEEFNRTSGSQDDQIPQNLENFIEFVSKTGKSIFPWQVIKNLFQKKLNNVINNLQSSMSAPDLNVSTSTLNQCNESNNIRIIKERIIERMKSFTSAPFTLQRMCELLIKPNSHYNRIDKYMRGLEKCVMVVTTVDPNGNKIFMDNFLTNGVPPNNDSLPLTTPVRPITPTDSQKLEDTNTSLIFTTEPAVSKEISYEMSIKPDTESSEHLSYTTESIKLNEETMVSKEESEEITNGETTSTYKSDVTEVNVKCASIETSSATVDKITVDVTDAVMSETEIVVSNTEMVIRDTDSDMSLPTKTTEVQITTCTSRIEPIIDATNVE